MSSTIPYATVLTDELLVRCHERASRYDRDDAFCADDVEELRETAYLTLSLPTELEGPGASLADVLQEHRRLAYFAAPTAHALTMHLAWVGVAAERWRAGDRALAWVLEEAAAGQLLAAGHAEPGNGAPPLVSSTLAERVDGGYRFTGHKIHGALTPAWSYLALHGIDRRATGGARIVHALMPRHTEGYATRELRETMGMRATRSDDTILDGAFIPERFVVRVVPLVQAASDPFVQALLAWSLLGLASIAIGMARRALDLAIDAHTRSRALDRSRAPARHDALGVRQRIGAMGVEYEAIESLLDHAAHEWSTGAPHGSRWPLKLLVANQRILDGAWRVIDAAVDVAGSTAGHRRSELERLFRDARAVRVQSGYGRFTEELVARSLLGPDADDAAIK